MPVTKKWLEAAVDGISEQYHANNGRGDSVGESLLPFSEPLKFLKVELLPSMWRDRF